MMFINMSPKELIQSVQHVKRGKDGVFEGFDILSDQTLKQNDICATYFCAFHEQDMVGVIKLTKMHRYMGSVWYVSVIDVRRDFRRQGIATQLYHTVNEWVSSNMRLIWSPPTALGDRTNIVALGMKIISKCATFPNVVWFEEAFGYDNIG